MVLARHSIWRWSMAPPVSQETDRAKGRTLDTALQAGRTTAAGRDCVVYCQVHAGVLARCQHLRSSNTISP